jgi:hypothetical protein|tara:strand:- start:267 stop:461 length:195 start_codon:yes stop_codon:yes gene_type:complete
MSNLLKALIQKLLGDIAVAKANIEVYQDHPAGIGEHPDLVQAIDSQVEIIAEAEDKIQVINKYF